MRCTVDLGWRINAHVVLRLSGVDTLEKQGASLICAQFISTQVERWVMHAMSNSAWRIWIASNSIDMYGRSLGDLLMIRGDTTHSLKAWLLSNSYAKAVSGARRHTWVESELVTALTTDAELPNLS